MLSETPTLVENGPSLRYQKWLSRRESLPYDWRRCTYFDSRLANYQASFNRVLNGERIESLIAGIDKPVVIDLMAPPGTLVDLFIHHIPEGGMGISVSLEDPRVAEDIQADNALNITHVVGDITESATWRKLSIALHGEKADLIMERARFGLDFLPEHAVFYAISVQRMWHMLSNNGVLLLEVPNNLTFKSKGVSVASWVDFLSSPSVGIEARSDLYNDKRLYVFIKKSATAPKDLPFPQDLLLFDYTAESLNAVELFKRLSDVARDRVGKGHYDSLGGQRITLFYSERNGRARLYRVLDAHGRARKPEEASDDELVISGFELDGWAVYRLDTIRIPREFAVITRSGITPSLRCQPAYAGKLVSELSNAIKVDDMKYDTATNIMRNQASSARPKTEITQSENGLQGISALLPRYYEQFGHNLTYEPVYSDSVDDHEVAWMQYSGKGKEGQPLKGRALFCECDFKEGVGWEVVDGQKHNFDGSNNCHAREVIVEWRHQELRAGYEKTFRSSEEPDIKRHTAEIILDLLERARRGELIEDGTSINGEESFKLHAVSSITDQSMQIVLEIARQLAADGKIILEGTVVQ